MNPRSHTNPLLVLFCIVVFFCLGIPVWWHSVHIKRPNLPHTSMQQAPTAVKAFNLPVSISVSVPGASGMDLALVAKHLHNTLVGQSAVDDDLKLHKRSVLTVWAGHGGENQSGCVSWPESTASDTKVVSRKCLPTDRLSTLDNTMTSLNASQLDDTFRSLLQNHGIDKPGEYHIVVMMGDGAARPLSPSGLEAPGLLIGQYRTAFIWPVSFSDQAEHQGRSHGKGISEEQLLKALTAAAPVIKSSFLAMSGSAIGAGQKVLSAAGESTMSFSLCNADLLEGKYASWDFHTFDTRYLAPIKAALKSIAIKVYTESQVLLYTETKVKGVWSDKHAAFTINHKMLTKFVDSHWNLNSGDSSLGAMGPEALIPKHKLHFVTYVPASDQQPLLVLLPGGDPSPTNSFWIPSWGGVTIINSKQQHGVDSHPDLRVKDLIRNKSGLSHQGSAAVFLDHDVMGNLSRAVILQLRSLMGLDLRERLIRSMGRQQGVKAKSLGENHDLGLKILSASETGFSLWELDALAHSRAAHNAQKASDVISSLSRLVQELPNLEMPDLLGEQIDAALEALSASIVAETAGDYHAASGFAQTARSFAEAAFSNPSVLSQLSYPQSHLIGVFMPFFLPVVITIAEALFREIKSFLSDKRRQKEKGTIKRGGGNGNH